MIEKLRLTEYFSCTEDIRDCEIMRAAIAHKDTKPDTEENKALLADLKTAACQQCIATYLSGAVTIE